MRQTPFFVRSRRASSPRCTPWTGPTATYRCGDAHCHEHLAQHEHHLDDNFASLHTLDAEAALLQHADRGDVVLDHVRMEGTLVHELQKRGERFRRYAFPPMLLADPVAHVARTVLR